MIRMLMRLVLLVLILCSTPVVGRAQPITVLSSNGLRAVLTELAPQFEQRTHHQVVVTYSVAAELKRRIDGGASFDIAVLTPGPIDDLIANGIVRRESRTPIARAGMAIAVRAGASKPDIATTTSLTQSLRDAKSIAFAKEGAGGVFFSALIPRLGLTEALAPKLRPLATGTDVGAALAKGDVELAILPLSELLSVDGVNIVGPFPAAVQGYTDMIAAISTHSSRAVEAGELIDFLASPAVTPVVVRRGMERVP